jgi:hypothetical protein
MSKKFVIFGLILLLGSIWTIAQDKQTPTVEYEGFDGIIFNPEQPAQHIALHVEFVNGNRKYIALTHPVEHRIPRYWLYNSGYSANWTDTFYPFGDRVRWVAVIWDKNYWKKFKEDDCGMVKTWFEKKK